MARLVPVRDPAHDPVRDRLVAEGRLKPATRPGYLPPIATGDGTNRLSDALAALRDEERY